jgi:hypothetical protein
LLIGSFEGLNIIGESMICIYREFRPGALETPEGRQLNRKAMWLQTSPENIRSAILSVTHAPFLKPPMGDLVIEIDGVIFEMEQLPKEGDDLLKRCRFWLTNRQHTLAMANKPQPFFGL